MGRLSSDVVCFIHLPPRPLAQRLIRKFPNPQPILYSDMSVGVPKEVMPLEKRVAQTPDTVSKLTKLGITVNVEAGAGVASKCSDQRYKAAGANIVARDAVRFTATEHPW